MNHCEKCRCPTCEIRKLKKENAELQAKNTDLWTELTTACQKTAKDFRADELQAENRRLKKENAELLERAHYAVVASDLSVERAEQAEAKLAALEAAHERRGEELERLLARVYRDPSVTKQRSGNA